MSEADGTESSIEVNGGQLQDFTIDQFAGASALILGSFGGLLMIIWKSRCACRMRLGFSDKCYLFDCERKPPPDEKDSDDDEPILPGVKPSNKKKTKNRSKTPKTKNTKTDDENKNDVENAEPTTEPEPEPEPEIINP